jgi:glycosyltransferase involved in cell wall biosynthesis
MITRAPRVSVIVPNYNHARHLPQRLDSVLGQTFGDFELIVLDDASTDDSHSVLARYHARPRTRVVVNTRNSGCAFAQWNLGLEMSHGEYVWIAESDDYADPRFLETLVPLLDAHPNVGLAYCQSTLVNREGKEIGTSLPWTSDLDPTRWASDFVSAGPAEVREYLIRKNTIPNASAVLFRRSVMMASFPVDATFKLCGDWLQWGKMLLRSDVAYVARPLNFWRTDSSNSRPILAGLLEWEEGQRVVGWLAHELGYGQQDRDQALLDFARRCLEWAARAARNTQV